jgi:DNA topoisomerase IA
VIGVGRVKTPTLAIVCKRELEIRNFVPLAYFEGVATAKVAGGQFQMRHAPPERILKREIAETVVNAAQGFGARLAYVSRTSGKDHPSCTICHRCKNCADRHSPRPVLFMR